MARFLVKMDAARGNSLSADATPMNGAGFALTPLMPNSRGVARDLGLAGADDWFLATTEGDVDPADLWDECHARVAGENALGVDGGGITYAEPDIVQPFVTEDRSSSLMMGVDADKPPGEEYWMMESSIPHGDRFDWHLEANFSGLRDARNSLPTGAWRVRIGHLDTGYTDGHELLPEGLDRDLQRSFVSGDNALSAVDPFKTGFMKNPGHGTGTIGLLAGGRLTGLSFADENRADRDYLGGAPHAIVVPVRIAPSVMLLYTSAFAQGLDYLIAPSGDPAKRVHVVSMSMGGLASAAWTDIVNRAYEAGVVLCTAAGNHYGLLPPTCIVYPARYRRVIAVCGAMENGKPYADLPLKIMCGCYGPQSKMATAMSGWSPNLPWALFSNTKAFRWDGEGTSAATPQVAAVAALYIEKNYDALAALPEAWMRVEAVRNALFSAARKGAGGGIDPRLGNGIVDAVATLATPLAAQADLKPQPPDSATFPFLRVLTGLGFDQPSSAQMLNVEILQLTQQFAELYSIIPDPDGSEPSEDQVKNFFGAITSIPAASKHLKAALSNHLKTPTVVVPPLPHTWSPPKPSCRKLQGYVFDPSISTKLQYVDLSETTYKVRWENHLAAGPIGEYLEIVDNDHVPLDLSNSHILARDGLEPSEGSPQFRQQMLYAIGMQTIEVFESALGRLINWAANEDGSFNPRLRLYPHGIQAPNAFYSPNERAIYFGSFKSTNLRGSAYPGMVYAALSHDIIAHEMSHALLDGMHKAFREPSNPDVLAFHEAFADIVALLQQFSNLDVVRSQSAAVRGNLSMESLLGNLARQFGDATRGTSALRSAYLTFDEAGNAKPIQPNRDVLESTTGAHDRGAVLVAAVYGAFLAIYKNRTVDLYRIASDGASEVALQLLAPDLVNRLAQEASRSAAHVLKMCIRALDYCPPLDITFGDFLRAITTADMDVVLDDPLHYRIAFIESFRAWGIYPEGLEVLSCETLTWPPMALPGVDVLKPVLGLLRKSASHRSATIDRRLLFKMNAESSAALQEMLQKIVADEENVAHLTAVLGLDPKLPIEITRLRFSHKVSPSGSLRPRVLISTCQQDGTDNGGVPIRWGVTLIVDLSTDAVLYSIVKPRAVVDAERKERHLDQLGSPAYSKLALEEPFMLLHQS